MPRNGWVLRSPWGGEQVYDRTTDGARAWAEDIAAMVREAEDRGGSALDVWDLNAHDGYELMERYKHNLSIQGWISAVRDYALAGDPRKWLTGC